VNWFTDAIKKVALGRRATAEGKAPTKALPPRFPRREKKEF
jgi:hypothetical protein